MIHLISTITDIIELEQIMVSGQTVVGDINSIMLEIVRSELSEGDRAIYDNFTSNNPYTHINISDTDCEFMFDRITSESLQEDTETVSMDSIPQVRKDSIMDFCDLVSRLLQLI